MDYNVKDYYESKWGKYSDIPGYLVRAENAAEDNDLVLQMASLKKAVMLYEDLLQEESELLQKEYEREYGWTIPALDWWQQAFKFEGKKKCCTKKQPKHIKHRSKD